MGHIDITSKGIIFRPPGVRSVTFFSWRENSVGGGGGVVDSSSSGLILFELLVNRIGIYNDQNLNAYFFHIKSVVGHDEFKQH